MAHTPYSSGKRQISAATRQHGLFEVIGTDPHRPALWMVRRPDGLECSGRWHSQADAQRDCDAWNARRQKAA